MKDVFPIGRKTEVRHSQDGPTNWSVRIRRHEIIAAWCKYVEELIGEGWDAYLLTFQFREMEGAPQHVDREMEKELERIYATILTRVERRPASPRNRDRLPRWIACPDYPVRKNGKQPVGDFCVNDGRHIHAVCVMPPHSRLAEPLGEHFDENAALYMRPEFPLMSIHVKPVSETPGLATDYVLKALKSGRVTEDEVIVLPRSLSEISDRPKTPKR